jgi:hypothetical protein
VPPELETALLQKVSIAVLFIQEAETLATAAK